MHLLDKNNLWFISYEKNCAQESERLKSPKWHFPQLALPPSGTFPNWPSPQAKVPQLPVHLWVLQLPVHLSKMFKISYFFTNVHRDRYRNFDWCHLFFSKWIKKLKESLGLVGSFSPGDRRAKSICPFLIDSSNLPNFSHQRFFAGATGVPPKLYFLTIWK